MNFLLHFCTTAAVESHFKIKWLPVFLVLYFPVYIGVLLLRRHYRGPKFPPQNTVNVVFKERLASGSSHRNLIIRFGGASRCLTIVVTTEELWVTTFFPFTAIAGTYDLEHRIPLKDLTSVVPAGRRVTVGFRRPNGKPGELGLYVRNPEEFIRRLGFKQLGAGVRAGI
jgi:hypothetical protein